MMQLKTKDLAELLGVTSQRISNAKKDGDVVPTADGAYDLSDPINRAYIRRHFYREELKYSASDDAEGGLEAEKLKQEVRYLEARSLKVELQNAELKRDLVEFSLLSAAWGAWGSAVRNNILSLGERLGRDDIALRDRVEKAVKRALEKSKEQATKEIERIAEMPVNVPDEDD